MRYRASSAARVAASPASGSSATMTPSRRCSRQLRSGSPPVIAEQATASPALEELQHFDQSDLAQRSVHLFAREEGRQLPRGPRVAPAGVAQLGARIELPDVFPVLERLAVPAQLGQHHAAVEQRRRLRGMAAPVPGRTPPALRQDARSAAASVRARAARRPCALRWRNRRRRRRVRRGRHRPACSSSHTCGWYHGDRSSARRIAVNASSCRLSRSHARPSVNWARADSGSTATAVVSSAIAAAASWSASAAYPARNCSGAGGVSDWQATAPARCGRGAEIRAAAAPAPDCERRWRCLRRSRAATRCRPPRVRGAARAAPPSPFHAAPASDGLSSAAR